MAASYRILVAQLFQETHGFTPVATPLSAFEIEEGPAMLAANEAADSVLGGILRTLRAQGCEPVPTLAARARPGGRVEDAAYARLRDGILTVARQGGYDAIALCLHGCMQTISLDSAEADLLAQLRHTVGPAMPIVAGFDLHAHAIPAMLGQLDYASAYKTNPHGDAAATGERVATQLLHILQTGQRPVGASVHVPMLTRGNDETAHGPLADLHARARAAVAAGTGLIDVSLFNVNPFIDGTGVGQTVAVYAQAHARDAARQLAIELAQALWDGRDRYVHNLPDVAGLLQAHGDDPRKLIIGDFGDRVLAGGPGDSTHVLERCLALTDKRIVAVVTDPDAVAQCRRAGPGAEVALSVGGAYSPDCPALPVQGRVTALGDGVFRNRGVFMRGATLRLGPYAVLQHARYDLLVTQDAIMSQDPGCYLDAGIDLGAADIIVVKSGYHFKLAFDTLGACACAETPGLTGYHPERLPFDRARPLYPLDTFAFQPHAVDLPALAHP
ncbi:M81 family metallopeptidase [Bordetella sp. BOR01]|uniref:M81 family metallopeptidase n=1 Tax=Bordetella sp. BOR01 TaxID=2854779 RepID=UPI001C44AF8B|nr:M81 family metallopeptidase [Bordetella sp. BOR01]MBV7481473.1 M81 family metallopeptidase [Bordetella sp. BOR01]